jgi:cytochrome d ubiquinol oxidase subunit II
MAPFPLLAGFGVMIAYTLLGSDLADHEDRGRAAPAHGAGGAAVRAAAAGAVVVVSIWTPLRDAQSPSAGSASRTSCS